MKESFEALIGAIGLGTAVAMGARRFGVPFNVVLVVAGLLGAMLDLAPRLSMNPEVVLLVLLPILVFEGALFADAEGLRREARAIVALALPGVAISLLITASVAKFGLGLPFAAALLLGALLSITDTVSVLLAFRSERVPHRLAAIMEGESLFNDGTALVLVALCARAVGSGHFSAAEAARSLLVATAGGVVGGLIFGALGALVLRGTPDHLTAILASTVLAFATSLACEHVHASPVIAVVVAGIFVGGAARRHLPPARVIALHSFWETAGFVVNVFLFLLVGIQLDMKTLAGEWLSILLSLVALHAGRAVAVYGCFGALRLLPGGAVPARFQHVMVFGNIKGALSMAAVLALPHDLPHRSRLIAVVFGVTLVTLLTQALPFRRVLRALGVVLAPADQAFEEARATLIAARRGQSDLDDLLASGLLARADHAERRADLQRQIIAAERTLRSAPHDAGASHVERSLLLGKKAALLDASRRGLVSPDAAASQIEDIDRQLIATTAHGEH